MAYGRITTKEHLREYSDKIYYVLKGKDGGGGGDENITHTLSMAAWRPGTVWRWSVKQSAAVSKCSWRAWFQYSNLL